LKYVICTIIDTLSLLYKMMFTKCPWLIEDSVLLGRYAISDFCCVLCSVKTGILRLAEEIASIGAVR